MEAKKRSDRRRFLKKGAALAGLAIAPAGAVLGSPSASGASALPQENGTVDDVNSMDAVLYGRRSPYVKTVRKSRRVDQSGRLAAAAQPLADGREDPAWRSDGHHHAVVAALHDAAFLRHPDIDPASHRLMIHGLVERPLVFSMDELKRLPFVSRIYFIECIGNRPNPQGRSVVRYSWPRRRAASGPGVPLSVLFNETGIKNGAKWIVAEGADGGKHGKSVPLPKALDDVMVAYGQNGEAVRPDQGFPAAARGARHGGHLSGEMAAADQGRRSAVSHLPGDRRDSCTRTRRRSSTATSSDRSR